MLKHFAKKNNADGEMVPKNYTTKPDTWKEPMKEALIETDADKSADIIAAVEKLQKALEDIETAEGQAAVKFKVAVTAGQAGVIGAGIMRGLKAAFTLVKRSRNDDDR